MKASGADEIELEAKNGLKEEIFYFSQGHRFQRGPPFPYSHPTVSKDEKVKNCLVGQTSFLKEFVQSSPE